MPPDPDLTDNVLTLDHERSGDDEMPVDQANLDVALTTLAQGFSAGAVRGNNAANQLSSDSQRMWSIHMTTPSVMAAHGMRIAAEAGAGRTRAETNNPSNTAAP